MSRLRTVVGKVNSIETKLDGLEVGEGNGAHSATYGELLTKLGDADIKTERLLRLLGQTDASNTRWGNHIVNEIRDAKKADSDGRERVLTKLSSITTTDRESEAASKARHDGVLAKLTQVDSRLLGRLDQVEKFTNANIIKRYNTILKNVLEMSQSQGKVPPEELKKMRVMFEMIDSMFKSKVKNYSDEIDKRQAELQRGRGDPTVVQGKVREGRLLRLERLTNIVKKFSELAEIPRESMKSGEYKEYKQLYDGLKKASKQLVDSKNFDYYLGLVMGGSTVESVKS